MVDCSAVGTISCTLPSHAFYKNFHWWNQIAKFTSTCVWCWIFCWFFVHSDTVAPYPPPTPVDLFFPDDDSRLVIAALRPCLIFLLRRFFFVGFPRYRFCVTRRSLVVLLSSVFHQKLLIFCPKIFRHGWKTRRCSHLKKWMQEESLIHSSWSLKIYILKVSRVSRNIALHIRDLKPQLENVGSFYLVITHLRLKGKSRKTFKG